MSLKVLIVEDDAASLELMNEVLSSVEVETRPVNDSTEAAALVGTERFDGIFLDLQMPNLHGYELAKQIRESAWNASTPIIVVTGSSERTAMRKVFDAGATFFLQKPIDRQKLLRLFRSVRGTLFNNRRQFVRVSLQTEVAYENRGVSMKGMSSNISQGGILFEAPQLRQGDAVRLAFRLPGGQVTVNALGHVVRTDKSQRVGVRFVNMSDAGRAALREFVDRGEK
jgi:two-component system, chemotaxis family, chemotaxis protein CheY